MKGPDRDIILVVEDEDIARKNLEYILKKEGYDVVSVNSGAKAINIDKNTLIRVNNEAPISTIMLDSISFLE